MGDIRLNEGEGHEEGDRREFEVSLEPCKSEEHELRKDKKQDFASRAHGTKSLGKLSITRGSGSKQGVHAQF